jgi:chromosome segregation ATPase
MVSKSRCCDNFGPGIPIPKNFRDSRDPGNRVPGIACYSPNNFKTFLFLLQTPSHTTISLLKEDNLDFKMTIKNLEHENSEMKIKYNQLKYVTGFFIVFEYYFQSFSYRMLQQQQERALMDHQNRLSAYENQLDKADFQLNTLGSNKQKSQQAIASLQEEVSLLKASMAVLETEKDKISVRN